MYLMYTTLQYSASTPAYAPACDPRPCMHRGGQQEDHPCARSRALRGVGACTALERRTPLGCLSAVYRGYVLRAARGVHPRPLCAWPSAPPTVTPLGRPACSWQGALIPLRLLGCRDPARACRAPRPHQGFQGATVLPGLPGHRERAMSSLKPLQLRGAPGTLRSTPRARSWAPATGATTTCPTSTGPSRAPVTRHATQAPVPRLGRPCIVPAAGSCRQRCSSPGQAAAPAGACGRGTVQHGGPACLRCAAAMRSRPALRTRPHTAATCRPDGARRCRGWGGARFERPALRMAAAAERRAPRAAQPRVRPGLEAVRRPVGRAGLLWRQGRGQVRLLLCEGWQGARASALPLSLPQASLLWRPGRGQARLLLCEGRQGARARVLASVMAAAAQGACVSAVVCVVTGATVQQAQWVPLVMAPARRAMGVHVDLPNTQYCRPRM